MAKQKPVSLDVQAQTYWAGRKANGVEGLALLHKCIERTAQHRDWDALSRFLVQARNHGQGARVGAIIRCAFGNAITFKANAKHPTGGTFVLGWEGPFNLRGSNTYGIIREAVGKGLSWDDRELGKLLPKAEKPQRQVTEEQKKKVVKHLSTYMSKLAKEGFSTGEILAAVQAELKKADAVKSTPVGEVLKKMVNGAEVFEPNF